MPSLPSSVIEPLWDQFAALPERNVIHPLGCHRPRLIPDRVVFAKFHQMIVLGAAYERIADSTCSASAIRSRRNEWIDAGVFEQLEQICLAAYDQMVGLDREDVTVESAGREDPPRVHAAPASRDHRVDARIRFEEKPRRGGADRPASPTPNK
ncbi:hypothetical protein CBI38_32950 (plasmid) [Rhodococcus oxybenzonivorans]|uniref:Transposase n=1 Tax=Rhodococcus oxybenzonivorans TaxID=1990687 RepID=A0A2S2C638_9NOCA|nr:hypothetical protein CBI38_32950 [Rhodococcus oxybenzonivorans]